MKINRLGFIGCFFGAILMTSPTFAEVNPESIIQIFQRLEMLEKKSRELTGKNEVLEHQIQQLKKVQKQGFLNVDEQLDEMRESLKNQPATQANVDQKPATPETSEQKPVAKTETTETETKPTPQAEAKKVVATVTAAEKPEVKSTDGVKMTPVSPEEKQANTRAKNANRAPTAYEKETYQAAFNKMSASPTAATQAFKDYIKLQPNSPLAANAQYWIGEIMYSHNNYKGAVQEFIKVLQQYKTSNKAPDAAIKLGYSFYALKNWTYARRTFEDVLKYFPKNENAVNLATKRLEKMTAAGH